MSKATFTFGRFNPPTEEGHGKLVSAVQKHAEESGGSHYIFPTKSQDKKKNPMSHEDKVSAMKKLFPSANVTSHKDVHTVIDAMKHLESKGHTHVTMVVGSDRVEGFHKLLNQYKDKEYPKIKKINVVSAGHRDPDAEGAEGMSASKLRGLVASGKKKEFVSHYSDPKLGAEIHDKVKAGMQMKESVSPIGIFLLGGPGSGKDYVLKNIFSRFDLTEVQADQIMSGAVTGLYEENKNLVINGVVDDEKIEIIKSILEGYEFDYVHVAVTNKVSRVRNEQRDQPLVENKRIEKFLKAEKLAESIDCFVFNNSIDLIESSQIEQIMFASQIEKLLERLIEHGLVLAEKKFAPVKHDKESKLPKKYVSGLSKSTAKARAAHWKKTSKMSDSDPRAYEPAPGDATAKTKPSKYTKKYHAMYGEAANAAQQAAIAINMKKEGKKPKNEEAEKKIPHLPRSGNITAITAKRKETGRVAEETIEEGASDTSLAAKAKKSGISLSTLKTVYKRGVAAWNSGHRPGTTPSQWGHARVNSYITKGKTYHTADKDLREDIDSEFERCCPDVYEEVDTTPTLNTASKKKKSQIVPPNARNAAFDGYPVVTSGAYVREDTVTLEEAVQYHLENNISFTENAFRPGSEMFFNMINEAKRLYSEGKYTPADEFEIDMLNSNIGEIAEYEGQTVVLDYPIEEGLEEACWSGYAQKGLKKKGDKMVPNCVPVSEESDLPVTRHKSPYEGAEVGEYTASFPGSPISAQKFAKHIISKGGSARIGVRGQDHYVYHKGAGPISSADWRKSLKEDSDPTEGHGIGKPWRTGGGGSVYVRTGDGGVRKVNFSQSGMKKRFNEPGRVKSFVARHHCLTNKDKTSASYWACRWPRFFSNSGKTWW